MGSSAAAAILLHSPAFACFGIYYQKGSRGPEPGTRNRAPWQFGFGSRDRWRVPSTRTTKEVPCRTPGEMQFIALHATIGGAL